MIQIKEEKIAELMFDIWHKSNDLKNPVMVSNYITKELDKVKNIAVTPCCKSDSELLCDHEWLLDKRNDCIYCRKCFISR